MGIWSFLAIENRIITEKEEVLIIAKVVEKAFKT